MAIVWFPSIPIVEHSEGALLNWKKKELIAYIRQLEHSVKNLDERLDVQARNMSKYELVVHAHWEDYYWSFKCSNCGGISYDETYYCSFCGAKMDEEVEW